MFSKIIQGFKEKYARFRGRQFYNRVNKVYTRSKEVTGNKYYKGGLDG